MAITKTGIHVDESSSFTNPLVYEENGQVNSIVADSLAPDTRYYTRGYVISDGTTVYSQNTRSFKTEAPEYLTFINPDTTNDIILTLKKNGSPAGITLQSSLNNGTNWTNVDMTGVSSQSFLIPAGKKLILRGNNSTFSQSYSDYYQFQCSSRIIIAGDITTLMSVFGVRVLPEYAFVRLFKDMIYLENDSLTLGSTEIINSYSMSECFQGCSSITSTPDFSNIISVRTSGLNYCFCDCTSIVSSSSFPHLIGTGVVGSNSFTSCFENCTSLTTPPDFPYVQEITQSAFSDCFQGCTSLTTPPDLSSVHSIADYGLNGCFQNCTSLTTPPDLSDVQYIGEHGLNWAFLGSGITTTPDLSSVQQIDDYGLNSCFKDCTSLEYGADLSNVTSVGSNALVWCYSGCSSIKEVTFPNVTTWDSSTYDDWLSYSSYSGIVNIPSGLCVGSNTGCIPENSDSGIPSNWTYQTY